MNKQNIRVIYPAAKGHIALRTEADWDKNIDPHSVNGCTSEFAIETEHPFFYFKPVLIYDDDTHWSCGENFLAIATSGTAIDVHPYFDADTRCTLRINATARQRFWK